MAPTSQSGKASLNSPSSASSTSRPPSARDKRVRSTRYAAGITIIASVPSTFSMTVLANSCRLMCAADAVSCAVTVRSCVTVEYDECCWSRKLCRRGDSMVASASAPADRPLAGGAVWWTARASCIARRCGELTPVARRRRDRPSVALVPFRKPGRIQSAGLEHRRARAARLHGEGDRQTLRALRHAPQRALVGDEHCDGFLRVRARGRHRLGFCIIGLHLHLAAGITIEVALLEHEVAALPPVGVVAE